MFFSGKSIAIWVYEIMLLVVPCVILFITHIRRKSSNTSSVIGYTMNGSQPGPGQGVVAQQPAAGPQPARPPQPAGPQQRSQDPRVQQQQMQQQVRLGTRVPFH